MAKNSIRDYSATNSSNTDIQSIDISEGCSPAGINNAIREVMADLKDVSTGAVALESPAFDSASLTGNLTFGDNDKAIFGAGSDLEISHNGTENVIDSNAGTLVLRSAVAGTIEMRDQGSQVLAQFNDNSDVKLFYNNNEKLATTATGVDVTGGLNTTGNVGIGDTAPVTPLTIATTNKLGSTFTGTTNGEGLTVTQTNYTAGNYISLVEAAYDDSNDGNPNVRIGAMFDGGGSNLAFGTSNSFGSGITNTALYINSSGNVGIGTSSPSELLEVNSTGASTAIEISAGLASTTTGEAKLVLRSLHSSSGTDYSRSEIASLGVAGGDSDLIFRTTTDASGPVERMRINSSGKLLLNTTSTSYGGQLTARQTDGISVAAIACINSGASGTRRLIDFFTGTSTTRKGSIESDGTNTSYNTSSDYRLKENVTADWDATTRLKQLNPVRFNFIENPDKTVDGFLAHEVQDVVPEAITGTKDAMMDEEYQVSAATGDIYTPAIEAVLDEDGNEVTPAVAEVIHSTDVERPEALAEGQQWRETTPAVMGTRSVPDYQGIDQSKLVPLLVKTIQELEARITALEAN